MSGDKVAAGARGRGRRAQFVRFCAVGTVGFGVNGALVSALTPFAGPLWAQALGFPAAATTTWWLNRRYTFDCSGRSRRSEWLRYVGANLLGWSVNNATFAALVLASATARRTPILAVAAASLAAMGFNFVASRRLVFRAARDGPGD